MNTPHCACFSLCTHAEAHAFRESLPDEPPPDSPWQGYLKSVYGSTPPPRRLTEFNFFYHHHDQWPEEVECPMAGCVRGTGGRWRRDPRRPPCEPATCRRWLASGVDAVRNLSANEEYEQCTVNSLSQNGVSCVRAEVLTQHGGRGAGTRASLLTEKVQQGAVRALFYRSIDTIGNAPACLQQHAELSSAEAALIGASMRLLGRTQPCGHREWVEVWRKDDRYLFGAQLEGHGGYGCWFFPAVGSGIWLNVGTTKLVFRKGSMGGLEDEWQGGNRSAPRHGSSEVKRLGANPRREGFPIMAADAGYDTVQVYHNTVMGNAELVVTRRACMADAPTVPSLATCTPLLDLRTWPGRHRAGSCSCNESHTGLNCAGVGERAGRSWTR